MTQDEKERLMMTGDMSKSSTAKRLLAARIAAGYESREAAAGAVGVNVKTLGSQETGLVMPSVKVMRHYYRVHSIDFNYFIYGRDGFCKLFNFYIGVITELYLYKNDDMET